MLLDLSISGRGGAARSLEAFAVQFGSEPHHCDAAAFLVRVIAETDAAAGDAAS